MTMHTRLTFVVGAHESRRAAPFDAGLEGREVGIGEVLGRHHGVEMVPVHAVPVLKRICGAAEVSKVHAANAAAHMRRSVCSRPRL